MTHWRRKHAGNNRLLVGDKLLLTGNNNMLHLFRLALAEHAGAALTPTMKQTRTTLQDILNGLRW